MKAAKLNYLFSCIITYSISANMKHFSILLLLLLLWAFSFSLNAQGPLLGIMADGPIINDAEHPCISEQEYAIIETRCTANSKHFGLQIQGADNQLITVLNWPLRAANSMNDCKYYGISAYVDQNVTAGAVQDYNCGAKTYDGHRGTDISIWPFPFFKMDNNQVEVIAAAAGTIIDKLDGNFDKNCAATNLPANYIVIQHADGSRALYFHMKKNSLTAKAIGQSVAVGEYLGVVGSSGSSSGPHLHFEVWAGSTSSTRIDPYAGPCNSLNASSWWAIQQPYSSAEILKASIHTTDAVFPACPATETLNESSCYLLPFQGAGLPPGAAKFYIFMRYETAGLTAELKILNPNGTVFTSWNYTSSNTSNAGIRNWTKTLPTNPGTYTFVSTYNGSTCSKTFDILTSTISTSGPSTFCQGGSVTLTASTGATYLWNTGATSQALTVGTSGSYTVTVTSTNGCSAVSTPLTVTVNPVPTATITPSGSTTFCQGNSVTLSSGNGSSYLWSTGATSQNINVSQSGNYTVTVSNASGCTAASAPLSITVNPLPTATITPGGPTTFCQGNTLTLSASNGSSYLWSTGASSQSINVSQSGNYTVTVTNASGCTAASAPLSVTVNPLPTAAITPGGPTIFCQGNSVTLSASNGSSYLWSTGASSQSINVSQSGNYRVTVSNASGCTAASAPLSVTVNPLPTAAITTPGPTTFCQGNTLTLSASSGNSYLWSTGATSQSINVSQSGNYTVTVSNASGCTAASAPLSVTVNPLPLIPTITGNGASLSSSYSSGNQWYLNGNLIPGATAQTFLAAQSGAYTVLFTDSNGCMATSNPFQFIQTGIESPGGNIQFSLAPNPNNGKFSIISKDGMPLPPGTKIEIYNIHGEKIWSSNAYLPKQVIDISDQASGRYFVKLSTVFGGTQTFLVIKI
jgi:murein DD-endopeptidase MepM/ murein hydrolase activator NlpD